jgi:hypothetical protein
LALPAHPELIAAFTAGLTNGVLPAGLTARAPDEATRRFAVYRNNVAVGLSDALALRFPVILRLVGPDFFRAMARSYLETHRPASPVLHEWGESFPGFLKRFKPLAAYPYMADVARIEIARGRAYHAADAVPIPAADLIAAAADPGRARLGLHPSVQVLHLDPPAASIWAANQPGAQVRKVPVHGQEIALVLRDFVFEVPVRGIGAGDAALIAALQDNQSLQTAAALAAFAEPGHDPQAILVFLMQAGVITMPKGTA